MKIVADLHLHSHYSRATSKNLNFEQLSKWAQLKGVNVVGTGDIAHPGWLQEMRAKLEPAEEGLFRLKDDYAQAVQAEVPAACQSSVRFMLAGEISSIYKKNERVRKIHNVIFAPSLAAVEQIQTALEKIGNIRSDGRPILGLDSHDLLEIILDIDPQNYLIPAHIWTPWFSLLGSKSGFDTIEECFEELTPHIFALETGLSSDPPMNWRVSMLDNYTLVSNSDAHSPQKLAREANLFKTELSYPALFAALKSGDPTEFLGTLEFFPQEGKYHHDGHRKCGLNWSPATTLAHNGLCPHCGKPVTVGVMHRVEVLADRPTAELPANRHPFQSLIPLPEILGEIHQVGPNSKRVQGHYHHLLTNLGSELAILLDIPLIEIEQVDSPLLAEAIKRMRAGQVKATAGFDGEFGIIKLFEPHEKELFSPQTNFFPAQKQPIKAKKTLTSAATRLPLSPRERGLGSEGGFSSRTGSLPPALNPQQQNAVLWVDTPLLIVAGPGTGKTRTLTQRIAHLVTEQQVSPQNILAITFTNKAAQEMAHRLEQLLDQPLGQQLTIKTFHALGAMILRAAGDQLGLSRTCAICSEADRLLLLKQCYPKAGEKALKQHLADISAAKNMLLVPDTLPPEQAELADIYRQYQSILDQYQMLDYDDLILRVVTLFEQFPAVLHQVQQRFQWVSVDEYQDVNLAQYKLLRLLTPPETNLCAIGDPNQAIYGFRGANRSYFLRFQEDYPTAKTLHLSQNYRSTQLILEASGQVIAADDDLNDVVDDSSAESSQIWSAFADKTRLEIYQAPTDKAEAEYIVHQIEKLVGGTSYFSIDSNRIDDDQVMPWAFADFAVLYRLGAQARLLAEAFDRSGMPYQTVGQTPFYQRRTVREILHSLWYLYNPNSIFYLSQMVKPTLFAAADLQQLSNYAQAQQLTLWAVVQQVDTLPMLSAAQRTYLQRLGPFMQRLKKRVGIASVVDLIAEIQDFSQTQPAPPEADLLKKLSARATPFAHHLADFLQATVLHNEADEYDPRADRVTLMTLHAAKGLEFSIVFIVGCEEDIIPYHRSGEETDIAEERRLFYVGMTRARKKLILTHTKHRFLFGQSMENDQSRFVNDIENKLKEVAQLAEKKAKAKPTEESVKQLKLF